MPKPYTAPNYLLFAAIVSSLASVSCATQPPPQPPTASSVAWNPPVVPLSSAPTLHEVLATFDVQRAILVGETHTRYDHHLVQLEVLKFLHQRDPNIAVGVEWFQFPFQPHLDDYLAGRISEDDMLERTGYFERWRFDYRLYRPIVEYAREHGIPLIALNAPMELTRKIGEVGLNGLPADLRAQLPSEYDRTDKAYETRLRDFFKMHPGADGKFEHFLDVQLTWDETMAEQAARYLQQNPDRRIAVFAGSGHIAYGSGIPNRLARRIGSEVTTLLVGLDPTMGPDAADFVVLSEPRELPPNGLLGAFLEPTERGVKITALSDNSAIGEAGVAKDDVLIAIDERPVSSYSSVKLALLERAPGDKVQVRYRHRNWLGKESEHTVEVTLRGTGRAAHP
jgi:uncharacterized iron-regulated protein